MDQFGNYTSENENENKDNQPQIYGMPKPSYYGSETYGTQNPNVNTSETYGTQNQNTSTVETQNQNGGGYIPPQNQKPKKPKKQRHGGVYFLSILLALAASFVGTMLASGYLSENATVTSETVVLYQSAVTTSVDYADATYASVSAAVADTVVEIYTEEVSSSRFGQYVTEGAGSGVIISEDGYIITNAHVIDGATNVYVRLTDGSEYKATVIGSDTDADIAVVKIEETGLQAAVFADSDLIIVGEEVLAVGNPLGELGGSVTVGIISALDREIEVDGVVMNLLQTDAAINPGNSGGGLFNMNGELVGIVNAKYADDDIDNIGFSIPSNDALSVAQDLIEVGYVTGKAALGISAFEVASMTEARQYGLSMAGVYIASSTNSEYLEYGDLILAIDETEITSVDDIATALTGKEIGDTVVVTILRDRSTYEVTVTLVEYVG